MLAQTIIEDAYEDIRVKRTGYALSADEIQKGLRRLNRMLKHWSGAHHLLVPYRTREELSLSSGANSYTIGSGGTLNTAIPTQINVAKLKSGTTEYPLRITSAERLSWAVNRSTTGRPSLLYFEPSVPLATIYFNTTLDQDYTLILTSLKPMNTFPDLVTDTDFPEEYEELLVSNLAVRLAPVFGKSATEDTKTLAAMALSAVIGANQADRVPTLEVDHALLGPGRFDFNSGEFDNG